MRHVRTFIGLFGILVTGATAAAQTPASPDTATDATQRGDVAVGYAFMRDEGFSLPLGIHVSDGWRVGRNIDFVLQGQFNHGTLFDTIGTNIWAALGGIRGIGGSRYGTGAAAFGQVLAGIVGISASVGTESASATGFAVQPGFGVDISVHRKVAIRPQYDVLFGWIEGEAGSDQRFGVAVVFRLFRSQP